MKTLGKTLSRLSQMGWEERRTRLVQEAGKRVDLALYRTGLLSHRNGLDDAASPGGKFFFAHADLPHLASLVKARMGTEVETILREADDICHHHFRLLGYHDLDYRAEIDWHLDVVHGKRVPMQPWFKIDFLIFDEVGDHKVIWELNRHQHLVTLGKACLFTHDQRYAKEAQKQWYSWQKANPYPIGINWASSLEVAFRSLSWLWMLALLPESESETTFRADVIRALAINGRYIERNLSTYFSPNTHLLGEATALFFIGTMCPEIAGADRLRNSGWQILVHEAERQVRTDGVYFEQSLYYHVYALDFFLHSRVLAALVDIQVPSDFDRTLNKMLDLLSAVSQAGPAEGFGDDDGGRVFNPRRNRSEHMTDPLALGAILFQREDLKSAARLTEEAIWLFGEEAISFFDKPTSMDRKIENRSFPESGIYVMASGQRVPQQMVIDAGPQGTGRSGHGHADALSVSLTAGGRRWLIDPGTFCYMCSERDLFRGTCAHNTLQVDGLHQAVPEGPFAWNSIPAVRCERWIAGETFTYFAGSHSGYMRLDDPVLHRRYIFHLRDEFWLIRDLMEGKAAHNLEINWHFAADITVSKTESGFVAVPNETALGDDGGADRLVLLTAEGSSWKSRLDPDFVSPAYGTRKPASVARVSTYVKLPTEHSSLLCFSESGQIARFSRLTDGEEVVSAYRYEGAGRTQYMIFANPQIAPTGRAELRSAGQAGAAVPPRAGWGQWTSDAEFLYFAIENGRVVRFILCEGSKAEINGKSVINHSSKIERFEWDGNTGKICSSDNTAAESFSENALGSFTL
jgi:Heparinase II/III-like protein/Heparinase II/III N-terminus